MISYYILFAIVNVIKGVQVYTRQDYVPTLCSIIVDVITVILHISLVVINPGYLQNKEVEFLKLLETFDSSSLCPECETIRTNRSRHCIICHQCVDRYDHHCPWINNCVGVRNHNIFIVYLIFQFATLVVSIQQTVQLLMIYYREKELPDSRFDWIVKIYMENKDHQDMVLVASLITIIVICLLFVIPMMRLIHVQLGNFLSGKTTNERYSRAL